MLLTAAEAAHWLRLSLRTLERLRESGFGPRYIKLRRRVLYQQADLEEWIASQRVASTSEAATR